MLSKNDISSTSRAFVNIASTTLWLETSVDAFLHSSVVNGICFVIIFSFFFSLDANIGVRKQCWMTCVDDLSPLFLDARKEWWFENLFRGHSPSRSLEALK